MERITIEENNWDSYMERHAVDVPVDGVEYACRDDMVQASYEMNTEKASGRQNYHCS